MNTGLDYLIGPYAIRKHKLAPLYNDPVEAAKSFDQIVREVQSSNFAPNREAFELIRQTALVSLWFYLYCLCSYSGPYDKLNDAISIDMCNVRQSDDWEAPGSYAAAFIPRGFYKTTVFTTGGVSWDLTRNPDERIIVVNATYDKAVEFVKTIASNFSPESLNSYFFPEHCAFTSKKGQLSDKMMVLPNRTKKATEPSVRPAGVGGASEGGHYTRIQLDDLIGLDDLQQSRSSSASMETAKRWMGTNLRALRASESSCTGLIATRYAVDDCYQVACDSPKVVRGWTKGDLVPVINGKWNIYYRRVEEDGVYLKPDIMSKESLEELEKTDFWAAMTQYYNEPMKAGLAEFVEYEVGECALINKDDEWYIGRINDNYNPSLPVKLSDCDVVMTIDPAATDSNLNAKICRSSIGLWAVDSEDYHYRFWSKVGFFSIHQLIDNIFEGNRIFKGYVRKTIVEDNAFQKVIKPLVQAEMIDRNVFVNIQGMPARGDKKARIRSAFGMYLAKGKVWATREAGKELREELKMFPMNDSRLDVLDESEKALVALKRPERESDRMERIMRYEEEEAERSEMTAFGY